MSAFSETGELYTSLSEALQELERRRNDPALRAKVAEHFSEYPCPSGLGDEPMAVMAPAVTSPNLELRYFLDIREHLPLKTIFYEFNKDKFVHLNFEKRCLGEMTFFRAGPYVHREIVDTIRVVDFEKDQGKPMNEIVTVTGEKFIDFHHRLVSQCLPGIDLDIRDFSDWFIQSRAAVPDLPYFRYLGLFVTDAILFSNFVTEKYQSSFTQTRVLPAFHKLQETFGVSPLIVPIEPVETDIDHYWCYYPEEVRAFI